MTFKLDYDFYNKYVKQSIASHLMIPFNDVLWFSSASSFQIQLVTFCCINSVMGMHSVIFYLEEATLDFAFSDTVSGL